MKTRKACFFKNKRDSGISVQTSVMNLPDRMICIKMEKESLILFVSCLRNADIPARLKAPGREFFLRSALLTDFCLTFMCSARYFSRRTSPGFMPENVLFLGLFTTCLRQPGTLFHSPVPWTATLEVTVYSPLKISARARYVGGEQRNKIN